MSILNLPTAILAVVASLVLLSPSYSAEAYPSGRAKSMYQDVDDLEVRLVELSENKQDVNGSMTPVVFWHGMGDTALGSVNQLRLALQKHLPGVRVYSIQIGKSPQRDRAASYFSNVNQQVEQACRKVLAVRSITSHKSVNLVGFSQGGQFLRALIQRCPFRESNIRVKNFISLGGQHQGIFGMPYCEGSPFCEAIREMITHGVYEEGIQRHLVPAQYWHDPLNDEQDYRRNSIFLADINNENHINETYKTNLLQLDNMVLVQFDRDAIIIPRETSQFGFYAPNQNVDVIDLENSSLYLDDRLGLRELNEGGRLKRLSLPGAHLEFKISWFLDEIASVYLNN